MKIQQLVILRKEILDYISDCSIDTVRQTHGIHHMRETTARDTVFSEKLSRVLDHYQQLTDMHNSIVDSLNSMVSDIELEIDAVINFIEAGAGSDGSQFLAKMQETDNYRGQCFADTHPEIAKAMGYVGK